MPPRQPPHLQPQSAAPRATLRADAVLPQWRALHEAAQLVAGLAGLSAAGAALAAAPGGEALAATQGWRLGLIGDGLADIAAILEGGIRALLAARSTGAPVEAAARAVGDEFVIARAGLLALASVPA